MKKLGLILAAAFPLLFAACSEDNHNIPGEDDFVNVSFSTMLDQSAMTRGVTGESDGTKATKLYVAVYNASGNLISGISKIDNNTVTMDEKAASVSFQLVKGQTYNFAFWAQNPEATTGALTFDAAAKTVTVDYTKIKANDESLDAFTAHVNNLTVTGPVTQNVTLKRPWAQLNYGTTSADWDAAEDAGIIVTQSKVTVSNVYSTLNLLDGTVSDNTSTDIVLDAANIPTHTLTVSSTDYKQLGLNYLLVGNEGEQGLIKADLTVLNAAGEINTLAFSNIPVQRNYRTNIIGDLLTSAVNFSVTIDPAYDDDNKVSVSTTVDAAGNKFIESKDDAGVLVALTAEVKTNEGLTTALQNTEAKNITVVLQDDGTQINFGARNTWGGDNTENIVIDGNGKTVTLGGTDSDWSSIGSKNGTVTIKNATVNFQRVNGGNNAWNNHALNFSGKVIAENVTFTNSVSVGGDSEFKNCTFTEAGAFYTLIVKANVNNVSVDNCTFTATSGGRGIKVMDQYIDEAERVQVKISVSNSTFTTAKKAAILVTNTAGAIITASGTNNISAVTEDSENLVWNDEDRAAVYDLVEVSGCTKKQE